MATPSSNQQKLGFLASMAFGDISGAQPRLIARDRPTANGADSSRRFALPLKSFLPPSLCSAAFIIATVLASPAAASDADVTAEVPAKGNAVGEASHYSSGNLGLSLQGYSGTVGGSYMLGGGISSPWIWRCLRVSAAFGVAFYPDALASGRPTRVTNPERITRLPRPSPRRAGPRRCAPRRSVPMRSRDSHFP